MDRDAHRDPLAYLNYKIASGQGRVRLCFYTDASTSETDMSPETAEIMGRVLIEHADMARNARTLKLNGPR